MKSYKLLKKDRTVMKKGRFQLTAIFDMKKSPFRKNW